MIKKFPNTAQITSIREEIVNLTISRFEAVDGTHEYIMELHIYTAREVFNHCQKLNENYEYLLPNIK